MEMHDEAARGRDADCAAQDAPAAESMVYSSTLDRDPAVTAGAEESIEDEQIELWAQRLEVSEEQLNAAIKHVGRRVERVRRFLANPDVL
jgi:hypothetical protein